MNILDSIRLDGRTALVTGGAGHIGRMCAETLGGLGANVILADLPGGNLEGVAAQLGAMPAPVDLADLDAVRNLADRLQSEQIEILVHTASLVGTTRIPGWAEEIQNQSAEIWPKALNVGVASAFELAQGLRPSMAANGRGSIILFSSIYGQVGPDFGLYEGTGMGNPVGYGVAKGGLIQLCRYLTTTYTPEIRTNLISPGGVARGQHPDFVAKYNSKTPMRRMATEADLAGAVAYFATDLSLYVSGQDLAVDGGFTAW
ncbi:MAG: SDR family oxidoreductase [Armatimonadetes bacterium]|nr:SDR family oxidoreductase [Armatimonadota bacterium]MBS1712336.1 SDR family oxidoreductase [Armatimonadota bacterium]MBX3108044.1 SDR family oxidoreductase [Fimbriimonadaceae bacterium]